MGSVHHFVSPVTPIAHLVCYGRQSGGIYTYTFVFTVCLQRTKQWHQNLIGIIMAAFIAGLILFFALNMTIAVGTFNGQDTRLLL